MARVDRMHAVAIRVGVFARGVALFVGTLSMLGVLAAFRAPSSIPDLWLFDFRFAPPVLGAAFAVAAAIALVGWALLPRRPRWLHGMASVSAAGLALVAIWNSVVFFSVARAGLVTPRFWLPLSAIVAALMALIAATAWREGRAERTPDRRQRLGVVVVAMTLAVALPVAQAYFFGMSDYSRRADVAVVLGAQVYPGGSLSTSAEDRVVTAAGLYRDGTVRRLIMSGGVDPNGTDEARAMRDRAVALGVDPADIAMDPGGVNTEATVSNTVPMLRDARAERILVVSQFYHLPRLKLAYHAAGVEVLTVPARRSRPILQTPYLVAREIPAFWMYWAKALGRELFG